MPAGLSDYVARRRVEVGVRRPIRLRCSDRVDSPTLIGWLRPLILIPDSATELDAHRVEPLLAHEMAHIRRHDYAMNLAQAVVDRVFFYHPALRWLSGQVRLAREHCCDDSAVAATDGGRLAYARSLAGLEELRAHPARLAASDSGLLHRVRRLLSPPQAPRRFKAIAPLTLAGALVASGGYAMMPSVSATTVLDGLDPVHLLGGRELAGTPSLAVRLHGYRYLFADTYTRERFLADPDRYAVLNVRACPVTGDPVRPDVWRVVDGRIVLFCCRGCWPDCRPNQPPLSLRGVPSMSSSNLPHPEVRRSSLIRHLRRGSQIALAGSLAISAPATSHLGVAVAATPHLGPAVAATPHPNLLTPAASRQDTDVPPMPNDFPTHLVGDPEIDGRRLRPYRVELSMSRVGRDGPLQLGERVRVGAIQVNELALVEVDGRQVWRRTIETRRAGTDEILAVASIDMDHTSLRPLRASVEQGDNKQSFEYDGDAHVIRQTDGAGTNGAELSHDLWMYEAGAHDVLMSALPLREGFAARIPVVMASGGAKYWAIPRVVASEKIDVGDGVPRDAWVVDLDWWGMGAQQAPSTTRVAASTTPAAPAAGTGC